MTENKPVPLPRRESEASHYLKPSGLQNTTPIVMLEVKPKGTTQHVSLGEFTRDSPPIGFSLEVVPNDGLDSVVAQITELSGSYSKYELTLHVTNNGDRTISVEVQELAARP